MLHVWSDPRPYGLPRYVIRYYILPAQVEVEAVDLTPLHPCENDIGIRKVEVTFHAITAAYQSVVAIQQVLGAVILRSSKYIRGLIVYSIPVKFCYAQSVAYIIPKQAERIICTVDPAVVAFKKPVGVQRMESHVVFIGMHYCYVRCPVGPLVQ